MSMENLRDIQEPVRRLAGEGGDLRERVRALVVAGLLDRKADPKAMREVMRATVDGLGDGLSTQAERTGESLRSAVRGLDEALGKGLYALRLALEESGGEGRRFAETDLKEAYAAVKGLEDDLVGTLRVTGERSQGLLREEFGKLREHLARAGSDTGGQAREVLATLSRRLQDQAGEAVQTARHDAREASGRLSQVASGILRGLADAVDSR